MKKIGIIGIGNPIRCDDGIGIFLIKKLMENKKILPPSIDLIDGGTGGLILIDTICRYDTVLFIDAVDFEGKVGESRLFELKDLSEELPKELSIHCEDITNVVRLSKRLYKKPDKVYIFGVKPKTTGYGDSFSKEVEERLEKIYEELIEKIKERGLF